MLLNKDVSVLILVHYTQFSKQSGPHIDLVNYLNGKVKNVTLFYFPFPYSDSTKILIRNYCDSNIENKIYDLKIKSDLLVYLLHLVFINYQLLILRKRFDLCIALDNLSTLGAFPAKKIGLLKKLVFYSIDFTPKRFHRSFLNRIYIVSDRFASYISDINWVVNKKMVQAKNKAGLNINRASKFLEVPIGIDLAKVRHKPTSRIDPYRLLFIGYLYKKQGLQLVIRTLPKLIKKFPKLHLVVVGSGEYLTPLKKLVRSLRISKHVSFLGFIGDHRKIDKILSKGGIGIATYAPLPGSFTYYADPTKIKTYLAHGLPVITTSVPSISKTIKKQAAGSVVTYTEEDFERGVSDILKGKSTYMSYRNNAIELSNDYNISNIFENAFKNS